MDTEEQNEETKQDLEEAQRAEQVQQLRSARAIVDADKRKREAEFRALLEQAGNTLRCQIRAFVVYGGVEHEVPITVVAL